MKAQYSEAFEEFESVDSGGVARPRNLSTKIVGLIQGSVELANKTLGVLPWVKGSRALVDGDPHGLLLFFNKTKGTVRRETKVVKTYEIQAAPTAATRLFEAVKPKAYIWVEYEVDGIRILVINTHLSNGVQNERRVGQLAELAEDIVSHGITSGAKPCATLFCGDTNADAGEPEMRWWHEEQGFRDTYHAANPEAVPGSSKGATWDNTNPLTQGHLTEPDQRVDFVSVRAREDHAIEILGSRLVFNREPVSDHFGVLTDLRITPVCEMDLLRAKLF